MDYLKIIHPLFPILFFNANKRKQLSTDILSMRYKAIMKYSQSPDSIAFVKPNYNKPCFIVRSTICF